MIDANSISIEDKKKLYNTKWDPNTNIDLHKMGVHYFNPDYLPTNLDLDTYLSIVRRGLTPPNALPIYIPDNYNKHIDNWLDYNYYKLTQGGVQHLGNECNLQKAEDFEKAKIRVCFCRISDYDTCKGAFGGLLINNFIQDFTSIS